MDSSIDAKVLDIVNSLFNSEKTQAFMSSQPNIEMFLSRIVKVFEKSSKESSKVKEDFLAFFINVGKKKEFLHLILPTTTFQKEKIEEIIFNESWELREVYASALSSNFPLILSSIQGSSEESTYIQALFALISDPETSVALKILKAFTLLCNGSSGNSLLIGNLLLNKQFIAGIEQGIKGEDSIVAVRYMELVCRLCIQSEEIFLEIEKYGLFDAAISLYKSDDLLLKLTTVEVISILGDASWTYSRLNGKKLITEIETEAINEGTEFYVRKYLILLLSKFSSKGLYKFSTAFKKSIFAFLIECLLTNSYESKDGALAIINELFHTEIGLEIMGVDALRLLFWKLKDSNQLQDKFYSVLGGFVNTVSQGKPLMAMKILAALGDSQVITKWADYSEAKHVENLLTQGTSYLYTQLFTPFERTEQNFITLSFAFILCKPCAKSLLSHEKSIEYWLHTYSKSKEILLAKRSFVSEVESQCTKWGQSDDFYEKYLEKLKENKEKKESVSLIQTETN